VSDAGLLGRIVDRRPLAGDGKSGSVLERGRLEPEGTAVVVKHLRWAGDWIMQATDDDGGRIRRLWVEGVFAALPTVIDHAMVGVEAEPDGDGAVAVMRDVSAGLFQDGVAPTAAEHRQVLRAAGEMHRAFAAGEAPAVRGGCGLAARLAMLAPAVCERFASDHVVPRLALDGWERFHQLVAEDVSASVAGLHADPGPLADALAARPATLVHGDLKLANLGLLDGRVVMIDWGTLTTWGPGALDLAWYIAINGAGLGMGHDQLLEDVQRVGGADDPVALRLAMLGSLLQLGWEKALGATSDDRTTRRREEAGLRWWEDQARLGLEALGG
jgi:hypothetical protein